MINVTGLVCEVLKTADIITKLYLIHIRLVHVSHVTVSAFVMFMIHI